MSLMTSPTIQRSVTWISLVGVLGLALCGASAATKTATTARTVAFPAITSGEATSIGLPSAAASSITVASKT